VWQVEALPILASEENKTNVVFFTFLVLCFIETKLFKKHMHMKGLEKRKINFYFIVSFACENKCENLRKDGKILTTLYQKQIQF
jgi:hypothetical protein